MMTFNLAYFAVGLTRSHSRLWWAGYGVHFLILLVLSLLSGSRSGVLSIFVMQLFCYHYLKGRVNLRLVVPIAVALLACAMVLEIVRNGVKVEDGAVTTGLEQRDQTVGFTTFQLGVQPLQILLAAGDLQLAHGMTLVSLVTNVVPRDWWPDKPESGGVFFTRVYTGDAWGGTSRLTPTFLGEGVINFGWALGILFFVATYSALLYYLVIYYRRTVVRVRASSESAVAIELALYVCVMWSVVALMTGEVTNVLLSLVLTRIVPIALLKAVLAQRWQLAPRVRGAS